MNRRKEPSVQDLLDACLECLNDLKQPRDHVPLLDLLNDNARDSSKTNESQPVMALCLD